MTESTINCNAARMYTKQMHKCRYYMYNSIRSVFKWYALFVGLAEICQASAQLYDDYLGSSTTSGNGYWSSKATQSMSSTSLTCRLAQPHKSRNQEVKQQVGRRLDWGGREAGTENQKPTPLGKKNRGLTGQVGEQEQQEKNHHHIITRISVNMRGSGDELFDGS